MCISISFIIVIIYKLFYLIDYIKGEKIQSVIHLRFDVTAENPWHSFTNSNKDSSSKSKTKFKTNNNNEDDNVGSGDQENIEYEDESNNAHVNEQIEQMYYNHINDDNNENNPNYT